MNFGPFSLPLAPSILFLGVVVSLMVGWLVSKDTASLESAIFKSLFAGLIVARLSFVGQYFPAYEGSLLKMLDFRDLGFDPIPGAIAGGCVVLWHVVRRRSLRVPLVLAVAAGSAAWSIATAAAYASRSSATVPAVALIGGDGTPKPLARGDGKPLVVNLWATWCPPCQAEMPVLARAQAENPRLNVVFVNQAESREAVDGYLTSHGIHIENSLLDPQLAVARAVHATGYPTTLFYDSHGRLLSIHLGQFSRATFEEALERFYAAK
jgi:YD repeat-containing protein